MSDKEIKTPADLEAAIKFEERSLSMLLKIGGKDNEKVADIYYRLGDLYMRAENLEKAAISFEKAAEIFEKLNTLTFKTAYSYIHLARIAGSKNEHDRASELYSRALKKAGCFTGKDLIYAIYVHNDAAGFYLSVINDEARAVELINSAIRAGGAVAADGKNEQLESELFFSFTTLAGINLKKGDNEKARSHCFDFIKMFGSDIEQWSFSAIRVAEHFFEKKDRDNALFFFQQAIDKSKEAAGEKFGPVRAIYGIAKIHEADENYAEAVKYYGMALEADIKSSGEMSKNAPIIYSSLGNAFQSMKQYDKAIFAFGKARDIYAKISPQDSGIIDALIDMGSAYFKKGEYEKAVQTLGEALSFVDRHFKDDINSRVLICNNTGYVYEAMGRDDMAAECYRASISAIESRSGEFDSGIIRPLSSLILIYDRAKNTEMFNSYLSKLDKMASDNQVAINSDLNTLSLIVEFYARLKDADKCRSILNAAIESARTAIGEDKIDFFYFMSEIVKIYKSIEMYEDAVKLIDLFIAGASALPDPPQPMIAFCLNDKGLYCSSRKKYDEAIECFEKSFELYESIDKGESGRSSMVLKNIAEMYYNIGRYDECLMICESVLEKMGKYDAGDKSATLNCLRIFINALLKVGNKEGAAEKIEIYRKILVSLHGETSRAMADFHTWAGTRMIESGQLDEAMAHFDKALSLNLKIVPLDKQQIGISYKDIGSVHFDRGEYIKTLECLDKQRTYYIEGLGEDHADVAHVYSNMAFVYDKSGQPEKAYEMYLKAFETARKVYGLEHAETIAHIRNIADHYDIQENYSMAHKWSEEYLKAARGLYGDDHLETEHAEMQIAVLRYMMKDAKGAMSVFEKIYKKYEDAGQLNSDNAGVVLFYMGKTMFEGNRPDMALEYAQRAKIIFENIGNGETLKQVEEFISEIKRKS